MAGKPISPALHGLIDYGFGVVSLVGPALLGLTGPARILPAAWTMVQGSLNAVTDQPYAVKRVVPFELHGKVEMVGVPALAAVTIASGALKQPKARLFFGVLLAALASVYTLTDWKATPTR